MKIGSLVECINDNFRKSPFPIKMPVKGGIYTVVSMKEWPLGLGIYLAEFENEKVMILYNNGSIRKENPPFNYKHFREIQPPIANIEQHINENTIEPVLN